MNCPLCKGAQFKAFSIFFFFYKTSDATLFYTIHIQTQWHNYRSDLIFIFTIHILLVLQTVCLCGQQKKWLADQKVTKVKVNTNFFKVGKKWCLLLMSMKCDISGHFSILILSYILLFLILSFWAIVHKTV